ALSVAACLRAGTQVDVAWVVETHGFSARDKSEALAITPGGGRIGAVLSGSINEQLAELADRGTTGRLVDLHVGDFEAELAGLSCGGDARCLLIPAVDLPEELWDRLRDRDPVCLVTRLDGDRVVDTTMYGPDTVAGAGEDAARLFGRAQTATIVAPDAVTTVLWPVPKLVIVGAGAVGEALVRQGELLGWHTQVVTDASSATGVIAALAVLDKLVVTSHDDDVAGPALAAALSSPVGYIGALGSRRTQQSRADWLAYRGVTDLSRIHGPAGLDIGANTPAEIAVSIAAEALAVRSSAGTGNLREKSGAIH
ncbi:MAG TPA: XdhC family protein, partial [Micromonosporaceae bacterium]|nr:XdhC family protein [Micromonosporaceae bacterium]